LPRAGWTTTLEPSARSCRAIDRIVSADGASDRTSQGPGTWREPPRSAALLAACDGDRNWVARDVPGLPGLCAGSAGEVSDALEARDAPRAPRVRSQALRWAAVAFSTAAGDVTSDLEDHAAREPARRGAGRFCAARVHGPGANPRGGQPLLRGPAGPGRTRMTQPDSRSLTGVGAGTRLPSTGSTRAKDALTRRPSPGGFWHRDHRGHSP